MLAATQITINPKSIKRLGGGLTVLVAGMMLCACSDDPSADQRKQAVLKTIDTNLACSTERLGSYYWEIGDSKGSLASGSVIADSGNSVDADTPMKIASATKWIFGTYMLQLTNGQLTDDDKIALTMRTGYSNFNYPACDENNTVQSCFEAPKLLGGANNDYTADDYMKFHYNGGHFQKLAIDHGLGNYNNSELAAEFSSYLGGLAFAFDRPQLAAGMYMSGAQYGKFLQAMLSQQFFMSARLGDNAVCTLYDPVACPVAATDGSPINLNWHYSLGHWVEDDTNSKGEVIGDRAYSSAGAFGFYPWIDHDKRYYGVLAREDHGLNSAVHSATCGQKIRKAWMTGIAQPL